MPAGFQGNHPFALKNANLARGKMEIAERLQRTNRQNSGGEAFRMLGISDLLPLAVNTHNDLACI